MSEGSAAMTGFKILKYMAMLFLRSLNCSFSSTVSKYEYMGMAGSSIWNNCKKKN
jgi:hypothetical protein